MRPLLFGYVCFGERSSDRNIDLTRKEMLSFANREGFTMADVFVERHSAGTSAFASLVDALQSTEDRNVLVPTLAHFAVLPGLQRAMKRLLEREVQARVMVIHASGEKPEEHK